MNPRQPTAFVIALAIGTIACSPAPRASAADESTPRPRRAAAATNAPAAPNPPRSRRGSTTNTTAQTPVPAQPAKPMTVGAAELVDFTDPTYGSKIRQLRKDDGHEHNFYYYRDPWNADGTFMLGIQSDLAQKNWHVVLHDGDGKFLKDLFTTAQ